MKNKRIDHISNIVSKQPGNFAKNFAFFFQIQEIVKTCCNSTLAYFKKLPYGDDIHVTFTS